MEKKPVKIVETVLRDGHQSLAATRMRISDMLPALEQLDNAGYYALEAGAAPPLTPACASLRGSLATSAYAQKASAQNPYSNAAARSEHFGL